MPLESLDYVPRQEKSIQYGLRFVIEYSYKGSYRTTKHTSRLKKVRGIFDFIQSLNFDS